MKRKSSSAVPTVPAKQRKTGKGTAAKKSPVKTPKKAAPKTKKVYYTTDLQVLVCKFQSSSTNQENSSSITAPHPKEATSKESCKKKPVPRKKTQNKKKASPKKKGAKNAPPKKKGGVKNASPKKKNASPKKKNPTKKGQTGSKKATSTAKGAQKDGKKKPAVHPNDKLTPNLAIEIAKKDLMFEEKNGAGALELSGLGKAKTAIQAVLTNNMPLLQKLIKNTKEVPTLFMRRSVDIADDALCTAMKMKNKAAVQLLLKELEDIQHGKARMTLGRPSLQKENTGRYNYRSLGHAVRAINVARGGREGNDAFTKDFQSYYMRPHIGTYSAMAAQIVDNISALQPFMQSTQFGDQFKNDLFNRIWQFARSGSYKVTGALVKLAVESDGFGFNKLHQEVLTCSKPEELTRFRSVSVKKKPYDNQKITPLHLSAINPNPNMMLSLLAVVPEFYITDKNGYGLIHYAAACEGSGPLEALVSRGVFPNQATTMGLTPLMIASQLGRIQNMIFLLKPRKSIPLPGVMKEVRFVDSVMGSKTALHFAASNGQAEACKLLISNGANIEAITSAATNKLSPIMMASRSGHFKVVKTLVEAKASIDGKDKLKRTPLTHAVMNGHYIIASYLLRKGADPNSKDTSGNTPTHYAAGYGWWHCVKLLIKAGADPNIMNDWKVPSLCIAFLKGHSDCADVLIKEAGVGVDFRDAEGWTMVMMTLSNSVNEETLKQLKFLVEQKKADVKLQDGDGWNAMHHLASSPVNEREKDKKAKQFETIIECATILVKHGCDISAKTDSGETPVNIVMQQDPINTGLLQLLMNKGASISLEAGEDGENVLHLMARKVVHGDQCQVFDLLWKQSSKGATNPLIDLIDVQDKQGFTPLLRLAAVYCNETSGKCPSENFYLHVTALFKRFIQKGNANINYMIADDHKLAQPSQKEKGAVIFHFIYPYCGVPTSDTNGISYKNNLLKAFASFKPNLNIRNKNGKTPLLQALEYGAVAKEAALKLISSGADVNMSLIPPGDEKDGQEENEAAEEGFQSVTPVILAAKNSLFSVVETLLLRGASSSSPDNKSNLLHHLAALQSAPVEVIKCLELVLSNGVDVNLCDGKKRTPLHYAVEALTPHSTTDVVEFLLEQGANVLAKDEEGRIPLHYAFCKLQNLDDYTQLDPIEVVTILTTAMKGRGIDMADKHGRTPLHFAAYRGATISFTHLIEYITDLDAADDIGNTPLSLAVAGGHDRLVAVQIVGLILHPHLSPTELNIMLFLIFTQPFRCNL
ncbi:putative poly(ADP-ribose) polymerase pme-5 isoform X2 [Apostichopus japonicus]|uniref:Putative poly(ADP-ribose) polymerase pme-5 isoform X2 n=1 Tax=Stichopus japonicus TaxID=307972 RepID=A0A2G8L767_STIJA|nr:putative poly(ADP-ribose) polymerase pme-5 isoform X2 [Apostichopus japonicus]